jgi:uncharacterized protein
MDRAQPPLANTVTLGVRDFDAQRSFYRRLGWPQAFDSDDFAVFELRGAVLALFPVDKLAADSRAQPELGGGGIRFNIIISVDSPEEVDELAERARRAGGTLTKEPVDAEFFVGRDAYFQILKATTGRSRGHPQITRLSPPRAARPESHPDPYP